MSDKKEYIIGMIPARMGSERLSKKNFALIGGKPLISYAIEAAKAAKVFDSIKINSEDEIFGDIAASYGVGFYHRPAEWARSEAKSDSVVCNFIKNNPCDIVVWVNPTSPLQTSEEIKNVVEYFVENNLDSLITVKDENVHCMYNGKPVNFDIDGIFAKTQDLIPVQSFVYSVMMWRTDIFMREFEKKGYALFCGKFGVYPVSKLSSVIIKKKEDLVMAEYLLKALNVMDNYEVKYDEAVGIDNNQD